MLAFGMTLWALEAMMGLVAGPFSATALARDLPVAYRMFDELGATFDMPGLDKDLMATFVAGLDQAAAAEKEAGL